MTIEEKLQLTIYEAEDAGIITESDKDEMISFIEEKRSDTERMREHFNNRNAASSDRLDNISKQIIDLDKQIREELKKQGQILDQFDALDPSLKPGPEGKRIMGQYKESRNRYERIYAKRNAVWLEYVRIQKNGFKEAENHWREMDASRKHEREMQTANTAYGNKK